MQNGALDVCMLAIWQWTLDWAAIPHAIQLYADWLPADVTLQLTLSLPGSNHTTTVRLGHLLKTFIAPSKHLLIILEMLHLLVKDPAMSSLQVPVSPSPMPSSSRCWISFFPNTDSKDEKPAPNNKCHCC